MVELEAKGRVIGVVEVLAVVAVVGVVELEAEADILVGLVPMPMAMVEVEALSTLVLRRSMNPVSTQVTVRWFSPEFRIKLSSTEPAQFLSF